MLLVSLCDFCIEWHYEVKECYKTVPCLLTYVPLSFTAMVAGLSSYVCKVARCSIVPSLGAVSITLLLRKYYRQMGFIT
jgi:hypothetical protein